MLVHQRVNPIKITILLPNPHKTTIFLWFHEATRLQPWDFRVTTAMGKFRSDPEDRCLQCRDWIPEVPLSDLG